MPHLTNTRRGKWLPKRKQHGRRKERNYTFYNSQLWRNFRKHFIQNNPLCIECEKIGVIKAANVVDHITPINEGGNKLDVTNLQSLCHSHHNKKSGREAHSNRGGGENL